MKPEQQLDKLFHSALEREPQERAEFLDDACAGDETLRKRVEALKRPTHFTTSPWSGLRMGKRTS